MNSYSDVSLLFLNSLSEEFKSLFDIFPIDDNTLCFSRWNWDYRDAELFQKQALSFVKEHRYFKIYIFCNHPHCFTMGRGLQKISGKTISDLVEFDENIMNSLSFPIYKINRGGGITFHYPGQWIFYPIINLSNPDYSLKNLTFWLLEKVRSVLELDFSVGELDHRRELLGLWRRDSKIASVGLGVERFVTLHGIALNVEWDDAMFNELLKINPCGLSSNIYKSFDLFCPSPTGTTVSLFHSHFCKRVLENYS